jgi:hypothetical protein
LVAGRSNNVIVTKVKVGKKIILRRDNPKACLRFWYCLPYRNAPNMNTATAEVVPPAMCKNVDTGEGICNPYKDMIMPARIEIIKGFFARPLATCLSPSLFGDESSRYNSRSVIDIAIATIPIVAADKVAKRSVCSAGKAKVTNGIPKKARLPKIVVTVRR